MSSDNSLVQVEHRFYVGEYWENVKDKMKSYCRAPRGSMVNSKGF